MLERFFPEKKLPTTFYLVGESVIIASRDKKSRYVFGPKLRTELSNHEIKTAFDNIPTDIVRLFKNKEDAEKFAHCMQTDSPDLRQDLTEHFNYKTSPSGIPYASLTVISDSLSNIDFFKSAHIYHPVVFEVTCTHYDPAIHAFFVVDDRDLSFVVAKKSAITLKSAEVNISRVDSFNVQQYLLLCEGVTTKEDALLINQLAKCEVPPRVLKSVLIDDQFHAELRAKSAQSGYRCIVM